MFEQGLCLGLDGSCEGLRLGSVFGLEWGWGLDQGSGWGSGLGKC